MARRARRLFTFQFPGPTTTRLRYLYESYTGRENASTFPEDTAVSFPSLPVVVHRDSLTCISRCLFSLPLYSLLPSFKLLNFLIGLCSASSYYLLGYYHLIISKSVHAYHQYLLRNLQHPSHNHSILSQRITIM